MSERPFNLTREQIEAITAAMPNFHETYQKYLRSDFRRQYLKAWAGEDPEKQREVQKLLDETTTM